MPKWYGTISKREQGRHSAWEWCWDIPFTKAEKWIEAEIENGNNFSLSLLEIYNVTNLDAQRILGLTDSRTFFSISFRIPFIKNKVTDT